MTAKRGAASRVPRLRPRRAREAGARENLDDADTPGTVMLMDRLRTTPTERAMPEDEDLDLPPLDGDDLDEESFIHEEIDELAHVTDALDDAVADDDPIDFVVDGEENGWLEDAEEAKELDVGAFDLASGSEERLVEEDEADSRVFDDDLAFADEPSVTADSGEEGPLDEDEELREEDLPELDADDGGDVGDEILFDPTMIAEDEELRWDDRAWERVPLDAASGDGDVEPASDNGALVLVPGEDHSPRDATWRRLDEAGGLTAAAILPGGSAVVAVQEPSRVLLVRIRPDGVARIVAEIDDGAGDDESVSITALRWDGARGYLVATGTAGVQAFRPV
ncbi:MAG: hypothetical protein FWD69_08040 [Polyangiaceae bacterium]|nr:hypothetical protein [Polyangiaceae bacterium]